MGARVNLSDRARIERTKLPPGVQDDLDRRFIELASDPRAAGPRGTDRVDGVAGDGSRFNIEFLDEFNDDEDELFIDPIDIFSC